MRIPTVRGRLWFSGGWVFSVVTVGGVVVWEDYMVAEGWRRHLADLRVMVAAFQKVATTGHRFKSWEQVVDEYEEE